MAAEKKKHKLDMFGTVLPALDRKDKGFYESLDPEDRKGYAALVLMRAMSSLGDQNSNKEYQLLAVNDIVNIGFWELSKYPDLQHLLLCITGLGTKQYHPWIAAKGKSGAANVVNTFLMELNPSCNDTELAILRSQHTAESLKRLAKDAGKSDREIKELMEDAKKLK